MWILLKNVHLTLSVSRLWNRSVEVKTIEVLYWYWGKSLLSQNAKKWQKLNCQFVSQSNLHLKHVVTIPSLIAHTDTNILTCKTPIWSPSHLNAPAFQVNDKIYLSVFQYSISVLDDNYNTSWEMVQVLNMYKSWNCIKYLTNYCCFPSYV